MSGKLRIVSLLSLIIAISVLICYFGIVRNTNASFKPKGINSDDLKLGNLEIGLFYKDVVNIMGDNPKKVEKDNKASLIFLDYEDGTSITIFNNRVQVVAVNSNKYPTPRGLKVGDNRNKALELYGKPENAKSNDKLWQYTNDEGSIYLTVFFKEDLVNILEVNIQAN